MGKDVPPYVLSFTRYTCAQFTSRTSIEENQCNTHCRFDLLFGWPIVECFFEKFMRCIESYKCCKMLYRFLDNTPSLWRIVWKS
ncbi:hypothetical protein glysoja_012784 [Glycine soja]|nr:hypothetical protein glysoja_012784 [Glycine soja]